jgi:hypothetical protein
LWLEMVYRRMGWDLGRQQLAAMDVIQGLLLNSTEPPIVQPNVHIWMAPATTPMPVPEVTASSRPLFDQRNDGIRHLDGGCIIALAIGFVSVALLMVRC